jgi:hypothetical protein
MPGYRRGPVGSFDTPQDLDKTTTPDNSAIFIPMTPPGSFAPAPDNNLLAWHDASQLTLGNGASVASWPDLSGHGNDLATSSFGGAAPTCTLNGLNGKRTVAFSGSQVLQAPGYLTTVFNTNKPLSIAFLLQAVGDVGNILFSDRSTNFTPGATDVTCVLVVAASNIQWTIGGPQPPNRNVVPIYSFPASTWVTMVLTYDGTGRRGAKGVDAFTAMQLSQVLSTVAVGGTGDPATTVPLPPAVHPTFLGARGDGTAGFSGSIAEFLVYTTALNPTQVVQLDKYLRAKWAI